MPGRRKGEAESRVVGGRRRAAAAWSAGLLLALAGPPAGASSQRPMRFERISTDEGLSQSVVNCMLQDSTGFLWLGTQGGLNRYDGYGFEVYRHDAADPQSLGHDWVLALAEDPSGDLWIGTEGGGLSRWRRATDSFSHYRHDPQDLRSLSSNRVTSVLLDRAGALWIGTHDAGLNRLDPTTGAIRRFRHDSGDLASLADDRIDVLHQDRGGRLWIGSRGGGLDLLAGGFSDPGPAAFVHFRSDPADPRSLSDDRVREIAEDSRGGLWVGTEAGLNRFELAALDRPPPPDAGEGAGFERFRHDPAVAASLSHDFVRAVREDRDGRLWIGTDGGLNLWREADRSFAAYHPDSGDANGLGSDQILALMQDSSGILWLSVLGAGLAKWNPGTWAFPHYWSDDGDQASNVVFALSEDRHGGVWVGTFGGGLERLDRATGRRVRYLHDLRDPASLSDNRITALHHDREGSLWIGTVSGGLDRLRFDPQSGAAAGFEHHRHDPRRPDSLSVDSVASLLEDASGRLWIGTYDGGLNLHLAGDAFARFRHQPADPTSLGNERVLSLAEDSAGGLWLATDGGGLNRFHPATEAFLRIEHDAADAGSLSSNELIAVHVDAADRLWVGTKGSGLDRLERLDEATGRASFKHYSRATGLPDDTVWSITSEASGALWLATNGGLARLDPDTGTIKSYDAKHGLQSNEFNQGACFSSPSGELFFGGVNGFNAFFPDRIEGEAQVPPVVLTSFSKVNQPVRFERPIFDLSAVALGHRDYFFSVEAAVLDFVEPRRNAYRYRLEGLDQTWIDNGNRRRVSFTNLDPGSYTLRVQGANSDGVWNMEGARLAITVAPPPWRTWWAYALYGLAGVTAIAIAASTTAQRRQAERYRAIAERDRAIAEHQSERVEERERLIEERERLSGERERLIAELEDKNAELERFNYTVAHDLKSPLVTIKGFLGLMERDLHDPARVRHDLLRIGAAADKMHALIDQLLELARLEKPAHEAAPVAMSEVAAEALELLQSQVSECAAVVEIEPEMPVVTGDRLRLLEVYQNLIINAVKYRGDQGAPRIEVGVRRGPESPVFYVRDNGEGIEPRYQQKIFGLFERLHTGAGGAGIGLAVVRRIVELHGGRVWVESKGAGRGSTFAFTLA